MSGDANKSAKIDSKALIDIYKAIREIAYGSVQVHIQDGKIIQIDKINKVRMR
ncbi:MAG: DUF2292 domain-containing protein [Candidatus Omnitrophica bacterium]|nr:DUF2292 domain-containing protein [Candidatus Omnitrophota bacterium]MBD3269514.1 DUF2292 domain-containing protein [Candidatus Omnitrophota bacterium]